MTNKRPKTLKFARRWNKPDLQLWQSMRARYGYLCSLLTERYETKEEAISGKFRPRPSVANRKSKKGGDYWDALLVPYRNTDDETIISAAKDLMTSVRSELDQIFQQRPATPVSLRTVYIWGEFCEAAGFVLSRSLAEPENIHAERIRQGISRSRHRKWMSLQLLIYLDLGMARKVAERNIVADLKKALANPALSARERLFFSQIYNTKDRTIRSTFTVKHLSRSQIEKFRSSGREDIPPLFESQT